MKIEKRIRTSDLCQTALCVALLCVSAYINVPLPFTSVSITAQTFVVNMTALLLKPKYALLAQIVYTLIGIAGVPVFSGGKAGIGTLLGPTGGYIIGFIAAVLLMSIAKRGQCSFKRYIFVTICIGIPVIYLFGFIVMALLTHKGVWALLTATVLPFIPLDIVKCAAASYICVQLNKALKKANLA